MLGDKDTYRLAFSLAGKVGDFQQVKVRPRDAMTEVQRHETVAGIAYVHQGMVQHTPDEKPAFMHRTGMFFSCRGEGRSSEGYR